MCLLPPAVRSLPPSPRKLSLSSVVPQKEWHRQLWVPTGVTPASSWNVSDCVCVRDHTSKVCSAFVEFSPAFTKARVTFS